MKYKIWNKTDSLTTPTGKEFSAEEIKAQYTWANKPNVKVIICDSPIEMGVFMEFEQTKAMYKQMGADITDAMTAEEVLTAISDFEENPPKREPSAEERIAAAMEFQNLLI